MLPTPENAPYSGPVLSEEDKRVGEAVSVKEARQAELDEVIRMGTNIEQLIQKLCPDGVPYRPLGELGIFVRGAGIQKSDLQSEGHPAIHYGQIHTYYGLSCFQTVSFISPEKAEKAKKAEPGDLVIVTTSEDTSAVAKAVAWEGESEVAVSGDALIFKHSLVNKYLSYVFQSGVFQSAKDRLVNGTKVRRVSPKDLGRIQVPVPPVEVQEEIVRILDLFTTLEAELEAELEKRRIQYAHYRDALLSFNNLSSFERERERERESSSWQPEVRWMMMGEICSFSNQRISAVELSPYNYTGVENLLQEMKGRKDASALPSSNVAEVSEGDILVGNIRPYLQKIWLATCDGGASADVLVLRIIDQTQVLSSYLYRVLASDRFFDFHASTARGGKMPRGDRKRILEFRVPVPSLDEQRRIAGILDQMDALVNDLSSGLPAEIAARRKQYEYYRDRLLSFPELTEPTATASSNTQEPALA